MRTRHEHESEYRNGAALISSHYSPFAFINIISNCSKLPPMADQIANCSFEFVFRTVGATGIERHIQIAT